MMNSEDKSSCNENLELMLDVTEEIGDTPFDCELDNNSLSDADLPDGDTSPKDVVSENIEKTLVSEDSNDFDELEITEEETTDSPEAISTRNPDVTDGCNAVEEHTPKNISDNSTPTCAQIEQSSKSVVTKTTADNGENDNSFETKKRSDHVSPFLKSAPTSLDSRSDNLKMTEEKEKEDCDISNLKVNGDVPTMSKSTDTILETQKRKLTNSSASLSEENVHTYCNGVENLEKRSKLDSDTPRLNTVQEPKRKLGKTTAHKSMAGSISRSLKKGIKIVEDERQKEARRLKNATISIVESESQDKKFVMNGVLPADTHVTCAEESEDTRKDKTKEEIEEKQGENKPLDNSNRATCLNVDSLSDDLIKNIFQRIRKGLTRRQLEEIVLQKLCELTSEGGQIDELKKMSREIGNGESFRKKSVISMEKQINQLKSVCHVFNEKVSMMQTLDKIKPPTIITRNVGLQVAIDSSPCAKLEPGSSGVSVSSERSQNQSTFTAQNSSLNQDSLRNQDSKMMLHSDIKPLDYNRITSSDTNRALTSPALPGTINARNIDNSQLSDRGSPCSSGRSNQPTPVLMDAIIDLTDKDDKNDNIEENDGKAVSCPDPANPASNGNQNSSSKIKSEISNSRQPVRSLSPGGMKLPPDVPTVEVTRCQGGVSLSWDMNRTSNHAIIQKYQIFAYQQGSSTSSNNQWRFVGDVDALPLPMSCVLTQFIDGYTYHLKVRAVDKHDRRGPFSNPQSITLK